MKETGRIARFLASVSVAVFLNFQAEADDNLKPQWEALTNAIATTNADMVRSLIHLNPDLANWAPEFQDVPLVLATRENNVTMLKTLLAAGADPGFANMWRSPALSTISDSVQFQGWDQIRGFAWPDLDLKIQLAGILIDHGASIFETNAFGHETVINHAARSGSEQWVDFLLLRERNVPARDEHGNTLVHLAALWARTNALKEMVTRGYDLEATNFAGLTPLQALSRIPLTQPRQKGPFLVMGRHGTAVNFDGKGTTERYDTARFLISLGANLDLFSSIALGWTNDIQALLAAHPESARWPNQTGDLPLHWAAEYGLTNVAQSLLAAGCHIDATNKQGWRAIDIAAEHGRDDMIDVLTCSNAAVTLPNGIKNPLHRAAENGDIRMMKALLPRMDDVNLEDEQGDTALDLAARFNHIEEVALLFSWHARLKPPGHFAVTALHSAAASGNTNLIDLLLRHGAGIEARDETGKTPLMAAAEHDEIAALNLLLTKGANILATDTNGNTILHLRALGPPGLEPEMETNPTQAGINAANTLEFLMAHGANVDALNHQGNSALHLIAERQFTSKKPVEEAEEWVSPFIKHHANVEIRDPQFCTPLHIAASNLNSPVIYALLTSGAMIDARNGSGATPLLTSLASNPEYVTDPKWATVVMLLEHGANVNLADDKGRTPLLMAFGETASFVDYDGLKKLAALLLNYGADVNVSDNYGITPMHLACSDKTRQGVSIIWRFDFYPPGDSQKLKDYCGQCEIIGDDDLPKLLLKKGAKVDVADSEGNTPLHYAAESFRAPTIRFLLQHGARRKAKNKAGRTALDLAYEGQGGFEVIPLLQPPGVRGEIGDAARRNDLATVKAFLLDDKRNANASWLWQSTPLDWACNEGHTEMVKLLIANGAEVNPVHVPWNETNRVVSFNRILNYLGYRLEDHQDGPGRIPDPDDSSTASPPRTVLLTHASPLQLALANGHLEIARYLVRHGAKVDPASAATLGMTRAIRQAIDSDPALKNNYSVRSWWSFKKTGFGSFDANVIHGIQSGTLLHFAVRGNQPDTVKYLLKAGADTSMLDDEGRTPLELARELKLADIVAILSEPGKLKRN